MFTGRMTEAERGMHMEGDTPTNSESEGSENCDLDDGQSDSESQDDYFESVISRRDVDGVLEYFVRYSDGEEAWVDRSDVWDFQTNTLKIVTYDKAHPIAWDVECKYCQTPFSQRDDGCEECRCDECERPCCHLKGVNYGCVKHPVI